MKIIRSFRTSDPDLRVRIRADDSGRHDLVVSSVYEDGKGMLRTASAFVGRDDLRALKEAIALLDRMEEGEEVRS